MNSPAPLRMLDPPTSPLNSDTSSAADVNNLGGGGGVCPQLPSLRADSTHRSSAPTLKQVRTDTLASFGEAQENVVCSMRLVRPRPHDCDLELRFRCTAADPSAEPVLLTVADSVTHSWQIDDEHYALGLRVDACRARTDCSGVADSPFSILLPPGADATVVLKAPALTHLRSVHKRVFVRVHCRPMFQTDLSPSFHLPSQPGELISNWGDLIVGDTPSSSYSSPVPTRARDRRSSSADLSAEQRSLLFRHADGPSADPSSVESPLVQPQERHQQQHRRDLQTRRLLHKHSVGCEDSDVPSG